MGVYSKLFRHNEKREVIVPSSESELACLYNEDVVTAKQAMSVPIIASAVNLIASSLATLPVQLYKIEQDGSTAEIRNDYRTYLLNEQCGDLLSSSELKYSVIRDYILVGTGFYYCQWKGNKIEKISYLNPGDVGFNLKPGHIDKEVVYLCDAKQIPEFVMGRILRNTNNGAVGKGIIQNQAGYVQMLINIADLLSRTSRQGGKLILQPDQKLMQEALNQLKYAWQSLYGSSSGENMMILNSNIKVNQLDTQVKSEISQVEQYASQQIVSSIGIPSKILYGGATADDYALLRNNCLLPIVRLLEKSFNRFLLLEKEKGKLFFKIDTDELTTTTLSDRMGAYATALNNGIMSINEVRKKESLNLLPNDIFKMSLNTVLYDPTTGVTQNLNTNTTQKMEVN